MREGKNEEYGKIFAYALFISYWPELSDMYTLDFRGA